MTKRSTLSILAAAVAAGLMPDPAIAPSAWAAENFIVPDGPYAGEKWRPDVAPYLIEPLDCLAPDHPATRVSVRKSAQVGYTALLIGWAGSVIDVAPASMLVVMPTVDLGKGFNREKLEPAIQASRALRAKVADQKVRSGEGSTALFKRFPGGFMVLTGANSSVQLRSRTIKYALTDEIDDWPEDLDGQGDPMGMVDARQIAFHATGNYKKLEGSTPKTKGASRIDAAFEEGDQRWYQVPCPHCGGEQKLVWDRLDWSEIPPHNARYACVHCGTLIEHRFKPQMLAAGRWVAEAPGFGRHPSFHLNALYSPFTTWDHMTAAYVAAKDNPQRLKTWWNLWLGESWEERGDTPSEDLLFERRQSYPSGRVPPGALFLTGAADVQGDRIEWAVYAWNATFGSWLIDRGIVEGDTAGDEVWRRLSAVVDRTYPDQWGKPWDLDAFGVDAGFHSSKVYAFCRRHQPTAAGTRKVFALDGRPGWRLPPLGTPSTRDIDYQGKKIGSVQLWPVGTWDMKSELYGALRKTVEGPDEDGRPRPGVALFNESVDRTFFERLTAEHLETKTARSGVATKVWVLPRGKRNEDLDIAVYCRALAHHLADKLEPDDWAALAARRGGRPEDVQADLARLWAPDLEGVAERIAETAAKLDQALTPASEPAADPPAPRAPEPTSRPASGGWLDGVGDDWLGGA